MFSRIVKAIAWIQQRCLIGVNSNTHDEGAPDRGRRAFQFLRCYLFSSRTRPTARPSTLWATASGAAPAAARSLRDLAL